MQPIQTDSVHEHVQSCWWNLDACSWVCPPVAPLEARVVVPAQETRSEPLLATV